MLRQILSKRVTKLKQTGAQTPIIDEIPIPATVIFESAFNQSSLLDFESGVPDLQKIINTLKSMPQFARGKAYGEEAGRWYRVTYPQSMTNAIPVAIGEGRQGDIISRIIPKVTDINFLDRIPSVADIIAQEITRVKRDDFNNTNYCTLVASGARDRAKALVPVWPLDMIWGWFCDTLVYGIFYAGWYVSGWVLNVLWDSFLQPQIDKVRDSINTVISGVNSKINVQLTKIVDSINSIVSGANLKVNNQLSGIVDAVNLRLEDLYNTWGIPTNMVLTPLHIRNADAKGFEFQSYGKTTCYWFSIGK